MISKMPRRFFPSQHLCYFLKAYKQSVQKNYTRTALGYDRMTGDVRQLQNFKKNAGYQMSEKLDSRLS